MADRDLQVVLSSGEITGVNIGGTTTADKVLKKSEMDAAYQDIAGSSAIVKTKYTPQATPLSHVEGQEYYDQVKQTKKIQGPFPGVEVSVGHGMHMHVENNSGAAIEKGMAIRQNGVLAGKVQIVKALADTFTNARMLGIVSEEIANGAEGAVTTFGEIDDLNTAALPVGVPLYLSDTVPGVYTSTAPDIISRIGGALTSDASGRLFVNIINNKSTPSVYGGLQGQAGTGVYNLVATTQDIIGYDTETAVVVDVDATVGTITLSDDGEYRMHFTGAISFTSTTTTRAVYIELYDATGAVLHFTYIKNIPRDATEDSLSYSWPIAEIAGHVHKMRIRSVPDMTVTFTDLSFDIQSVSIS